MSWFCCVLGRAPTSPLFPYTTLFRSVARGHEARIEDVGGERREHERERLQLVLHLRVGVVQAHVRPQVRRADRKSTRLNSSHSSISYAVFCLKKKTLSNHPGYHRSR